MSVLTTERIVCYTAVFSVVTHRSPPSHLGVIGLRDDTKNACVADYWKKRCWKVWTDTCIYINACWNDKWQRKTGRTTMVLTRAGLPVTHLFLPRWSQTRFPAVARRWARTGSRTFLGPSPTWFGARRPSAPVRPTSIHCMYQKESQRHDPGQKANLL